MREGQDLNQLERDDVKLEALRSKLNEMVEILGVSHIKVLRLSQEIDDLINVIQRRQRVSTVTQEQLAMVD